jgi:tetratricopeptide (TPR) repeat protein
MRKWLGVGALVAAALGFASLPSVFQPSTSDKAAQADALASSAQLYALAFRYDEAIGDMNAAVALDPTNPALYVLRGNITLLIYEWDAVLADYNTAIQLDPDYADAYFYRGVLYYTRIEYLLALDDFNHYLELAPDGEHAADAATYIEEIERTQAALDG